MDFILGCNYWASNAGIEMWRQFDAEAIKNDLKILSQHGVKYLRVFPLWRDFQPIKPNLGSEGRVFEYVMEDGSYPENDYFLDEAMLGRFSEFLDICDAYGIKLIVGLITGWMSGGLFIPTALYGKNVLTDPLALYFEQLFIKGFVEKFKARQTICAWDLGNECNCAGEIKDRFSAVSWTASISNAIRATDPERPVVSGMHSLTLEGAWQIQDQARFTDILTTHPYPLWCRHTTIDETLSFRTTMHATAETKLYADIGEKPCLAEEIGTMGPMVCSDEKAADFLRLNMFSLWANGSSGVMWWYNHDQDLLNSFPYTVNIIERELGLINNQNKPKPALDEMKKFSVFLEKSKIDLPKAKEQGVCLLTKGQDQWGVAYMTYALAKSVGLNLKFAYAYEKELPPSNLYLMPSVKGMMSMHKNAFNQLKQRVFEGAELYISFGNAYFEGFEEFIGLKVIDSSVYGKNDVANIDGEEIPFYSPSTRKYVATTASVLATDSNNEPFITVNEYGLGKVYFIAAPIESNLVETHNGFDSSVEKIYKKIFKKHIDNLPISLQAKGVVFTYHPASDGAYFVAINHSDSEKPLNLDLKGNYEIESVVYGDAKTIKPYDACVLKLK